MMVAAAGSAIASLAVMRSIVVLDADELVESVLREDLITEVPLPNVRRLVPAGSE